MNREDIVRMAQEAGWEMDDSLVLEPEVIWYISQGQIERFATLVASAEREAIAKMVEPWLLDEYVQKIRNRGQA